jgi:hypothetical protein
MNDIAINMLITTLVGILADTVKNPKSKAKLKKNLLRLRDAIDALYAEEDE